VVPKKKIKKEQVE
nr:Chain B, Histone-lysine N-methyltransferase NSD3 [Homo sapiens]